MSQVLNTNMASLTAQRHLNSSQSAMQKALERLSSGKRINSAKDDAAGLGIASRMTTQINGMSQAIRNANDGISISQTAEGALATSTEMLQRIRTLAVQSSNATNASVDRQALQDEVNELTAELNRIATTTTFNGHKLLDGSMGAANYQVGANAGDILTTTGMNMQTHVYGNHRTYSIGEDPTKGATFNSDLTISGSKGSQVVNLQGSAKNAAAAINAVSSRTGVEARAKTEAYLGMMEGSYTLELKSNNDKAVTVAFSVTTGDQYAAAINAINAVSAKTGIVAEYDTQFAGIRLTNATGESITVADLNDTNGAFLSTYGYGRGSPMGNPDLPTPGMSDIVSKDGTTSLGTLSFLSDASFSVKGDAIHAKDQTSSLHSVASLDVTNFNNAQIAIDIVDSALNVINGERAKYGALQSRFESVIQNLEVNVENTSSARSRIMDADYAAETAELSRASILQQAATAMLAQANQNKQTILSLLR